MNHFLFAMLFLFGVLAFVTVLVLVRKGIIARSRSRAASAAAVDEYRRSRDKADLGLLCPICQGMAEPMSDTHNQYHCLECDYQFVDALHLWRG